MPTQERQLAADILVSLLRTASSDLRRRCALGLVRVQDAPKALLRYLARDEFQVAQPLLENGIGFDDSDLIATVRAGVSAHWLAIARRRGVNEAVTDALVQAGDIGVIEALLRNTTARFSAQGIDMMVARSRAAVELSSLLVGRSEVRASQALVMFWWVEFEVRVQIVRRYDPSLPPILADEDRILQVFHNLVRNAIEAMPTGGRLTLVTRLSMNPLFAKVDLGQGQRSMAEIQVLDEGQGIPEGVRARLFTPFFTTKDKGLGLGLALCHRIIEEHRGAIQIASEPGRGTAVSCFLPVAR